MSAKTLTDCSKQLSGSRITFETECVDHLCRLQSKLVQMSGIRHNGPNLDTLDVAKLLMVEIINFAQPRFSDAEFCQIAPRISEVYERTKSLEGKIQQSPWSIVSRLTGRQKASAFEITSAYEELRGDYVQLFVEFFAQCASRFDKSPGEKTSFLECVDAIVTEFGRHW